MTHEGCERCVTVSDGTRYYCGEHRAYHVDVGEGTILYLDSPGWTVAGLDRLRPPSTIDRAVAIGLTRAQAERFDATGQLNAIVSFGEQAQFDAERKLKLETMRRALAELTAPPPVAGNRLARRTAKAEQRRARR